MEILNGFVVPILPFVKVGIMIFLFLYVAFAAVVVRQVKLMTETLELGHESPIKSIVVVHFAASVLIFVLSLVVL
jgi:hypothetical protein